MIDPDDLRFLLLYLFTAGLLVGGAVAAIFALIF